ncbi:MAG: hypothetical protein ACYSWQ_24780, partial [Planctomycetota bacterium]
LEYGLNAGNMSEGIIIDIRDGFGGTPGYEYIAPFLKYGLGTTSIKSTSRSLSLLTAVLAVVRNCWHITLRRQAKEF